MNEKRRYTLYTPKNEHMDSRDDDDDDDSRGFDTTTTTLTTTTTTRAAKNTNTTNNNNNAVFFDKVKRMKEKAKQSASSGLQKMSRKIKIPSSSTSLSGGSGANNGVANTEDGARHSSYGRQSPALSSSFEGTSPLALAALEDERRARTTTATSSTSSTTRNVSTKEDEETMKQLREELVRQQMRHDETAKMVLRLQEDVERAREEKEDLRVKSARSWQEQRDMLDGVGDGKGEDERRRREREKKQ